MPRFFVDALCETTVVCGDDARHIAKSLRMAPGESLTLCDGRGREAQGVIVSLSPDAVTVRIGESAPAPTEPSLFLSLYLALAKGDKPDLVVQKAVELGASEIVLVLTERCVSRPKPAEGEKKVARLQKIAAEAAKQCGRGRIPAVRGILPLKKAIDEMQQFPCRFALYEGSCPPLRAQLPADCTRIALLSGCEGGFSRAEIEQVQSANIAAASLGPRILRCETAPIAALAAVMFALGEMD